MLRWLHCTFVYYTSLGSTKLCGLHQQWQSGLSDHAWSLEEIAFASLILAFAFSLILLDF